MTLDGIRWFLSLAIYVSMAVLCVMRADYAGIGGLAGSAIGFIGFAWAPGQDSMTERLGNGFVRLLLGMCIGFVLGALAQFFLPLWA